jgi:hypothetical protein
MITKLYSLYDTPFDHDVCHLFEHVVLRIFLLELTKHGYKRAFFGWLNGNTIDSTVFFDLGVYSNEIAYLFDNHLKNLDNFDADLIDQSIAHIEAEMSSIITVVDKALLRKQLGQLSRIARSEDIGADILPAETPLRVTYEPNLFEEVSVLINVFCISEKTQKAFLSLHPAILDIIRGAAIDKESAYPTGKSALAMNDDGMGIAWRFNVRKGLSVKTLEDSTKQHLEKFDLAEYAKHIDLYRNNIANDSSCNARLIQYYEQTGIRSTREELAELSTSARMVDIMNNMTVRFSPIKGKLKKIEWDY